MIKRGHRAARALGGLLFLSALAAAPSARAQSPAQSNAEEAPESPVVDQLVIRLETSTSTIDRELACPELARRSDHSPAAFAELSKVMTMDLSDRVRLAAAKAVITFPGDDAIRLANDFLKTEPGAQDRGLFLLDLATEPAHIENSDVTRSIATIMETDPDAQVRRTAALALGRRADPVGLPAALRVQSKDADESVRAAALMAVSVLTRRPVKAAKSKGRPKPPAPSLDAIKGVDPCPPPWAWCECTGVIVRPPKCRTRTECHRMYNGVLQIGIACTWSGIDLKQDLDHYEKLPSPQ